MYVAVLAKIEKHDTFTNPKTGEEHAIAFEDWAVVEVASNEAASLEAMSAYDKLGYDVSRRVATTQEYVAYANGEEIAA